MFFDDTFISFFCPFLAFFLLIVPPSLGLRTLQLRSYVITAAPKFSFACFTGKFHGPPWSLFLSCPLPLGHFLFHFSSPIFHKLEQVPYTTSPPTTPLSQYLRGFCVVEWNVYVITKTPFLFFRELPFPIPCCPKRAINHGTMPSHRGRTYGPILNFPPPNQSGWFRHGRVIQAGWIRVLTGTVILELTGNICSMMWEVAQLGCKPSGHLLYQLEDIHSERSQAKQAKLRNSQEIETYI